MDSTEVFDALDRVRRYCPAPENRTVTSKLWALDGFAIGTCGAAILGANVDCLADKAVDWEEPDANIAKSVREMLAREKPRARWVGQLGVLRMFAGPWQPMGRMFCDCGGCEEKNRRLPPHRGGWLGDTGVILDLNLLARTITLGEDVAAASLDVWGELDAVRVRYVNASDEQLRWWALIMPMNGEDYPSPYRPRLVDGWVE